MCGFVQVQIFYFVSPCLTPHLSSKIFSFSLSHLFCERFSPILFAFVAACRARRFASLRGRNSSSFGPFFATLQLLSQEAILPSWSSIVSSLIFLASSSRTLTLLSADHPILAYFRRAEQKAMAPGVNTTDVSNRKSKKAFC